MRQEHEHVLLLDSGNALAGTAGLARNSLGRVNIEAMNLLGYDAVGLGQYDLRLGPTVLRERIQEARFPILSANVVISETGKLLATPYITREIGGHRVGIIGLTEPLDPLPRAAGEQETLRSQDPLETGLPYLEAVLREADIVIVLSHMGQALDEALAAQVPGIDVIIGGRDRMVLSPARYHSTGAIITQMGSLGQLVGVLELQISPTGEVVGFEGTAELLMDKYADDPAMVELLDKYRQ